MWPTYEAQVAQTVPARHLQSRRRHLSSELIEKKAPGAELWPIWSLEQTPLVDRPRFCVWKAENGHGEIHGGWSEFHEKASSIAPFQSRRQPGSAFKPIIYCGSPGQRVYAGIPLLSILPLCSKTRGARFCTWKPKNYREKIFRADAFPAGAWPSPETLITIKISSGHRRMDYAIDYSPGKLGHFESRPGAETFPLPWALPAFPFWRSFGPIRFLPIMDILSSRRLSPR